MLILGIDPGLNKTGWGIIRVTGNNIKFVASGLIKTKASDPLYHRLATLDAGISEVVKQYSPDVAAIEETFMNNNAASALKLGQARGVVLTAPARAGLAVYEYGANKIKKSVVGNGHATKTQIGMMIGVLLPQAGKISEDEADALAIGICHAHHIPAIKREERLVELAAE